MTTAELLAHRDHVLLNFDGTVCAVFGGALSSREATDRLKVLVGDGIPPEVAASDDPFDVLRYAASCGPATARVVETQLRRLELEAVTTAPLTEGIAAALSGLRDVGYTVTIVSNTSVDAIRAFLVLHDIVQHVRAISARSKPDPELLMPSPYFVEQAVMSLGTSPEFCVLVGDSASDAARAAGIDAVLDSLDQLRP